MAPTLIAPRLPFQEGSKVQINQQGNEQRGMLDRRRSMTVSFSVFEYHLLEQSGAQPSGGYRLSVTGVDKNGDRLVVKWQMTEPRVKAPGPGSHPAEVVVIDKFDGKIVFERVGAKR